MALETLTSHIRYSVALNGDFRMDVEMNLIKVAQQVYSEVGSTTGHASRAALAIRVLNSPASYVDIFAKIVASDPLGVNFTTANITDQNMQDAISATWNAVAGV